MSQIIVGSEMLRLCRRKFSGRPRELFGKTAGENRLRMVPYQLDPSPVLTGAGLDCSRSASIIQKTKKEGD